MGTVYIEREYLTEIPWLEINQTIDLRSNGTGVFVPYSGATSDVDLGFNDLTTTGNLAIRSDTGYIDLGATASDYKIQWTGSDAVHTVSSGNFVFSGGKVGIGTDEPIGKLDVSNGAVGFVVGADANVDTRTDAKQKYGRMGIPHYLNAEQPMAVFLAGSNAATNGLYIGGGSGYLNAANLIIFYLAEDTTTTTGTARARMNYDEFKLYSGVDMFLEGDNQKLYQGAGDDYSQYFGGTNQNFELRSGDFVFTGGNVTISELAGTGNAYACVDSAGKLYRSATACT